MISIVKHDSKLKRVAEDSYSIYVNEKHIIDFEHYREPKDLARLLRDAADQVDIDNGITPEHLKHIPEPKRKLSMMERMNGIAAHLEKQEMDY